MTDKEREYVAIGLVILLAIFFTIVIGLSRPTPTPQQDYDSFIQMKVDNQKWLDEQRSAVQKVEMDVQVKRLTH